ncbi:hypothetical protein [Clostridium thermarum]|uniref:hypothetical protein n=1 Tax=Clostridium thermarum TaxID=1716543 RepID=UPI00112452FC|nr:hypothetical protein [Clostridium thermarum]
MKSSKLKKLEKLILADDGLLVPLILGNGLDEDKVEGICSILKELQVEWEKSDSIPQKAIDIFTDFFSAMESACGLYSEEESDKIMKATDKIMGIAGESLIQK